MARMADDLTVLAERELARHAYHGRLANGMARNRMVAEIGLVALGARGNLVKMKSWRLILVAQRAKLFFGVVMRVRVDRFVTISAERSRAIAGRCAKEYRGSHDAGRNRRPRPIRRP